MMKVVCDCRAQQYQQQQLSMSAQIKNFQLAYQTRQSPFPNRAKKPEYHRSLLKEISVLKVFTRTAKGASFSQKQSKETVQSEAQRRDEERDRLIVVSKFKNTSQLLLIQNLTKNFKLHRQKIKTFASDSIFPNQHSEKAIKCYSGKALKYAMSTEKMETHQMSTIQHDRRSDILITRKSQLNNYPQISNKEKERHEGRERKQGKISRSKMSKEMKTISVQKIHERRHAVLPNNSPQLKALKSESYIVVEYPSERVIVSHRATLTGEIASLTKIMTFYTTLHIAAAKNKDIKTTTVRVSQSSIGIGGTTAELSQGEQYTIQQLLYGMMLPSGNDAASELALWGGSLLDFQKGQKTWQTLFVNQMNKQARTIGLKHTQFGNPHGLPNQCAKSNAADIAKLCCKCMKNTLFRRVVQCQRYKVAVKGSRGTRVLQWENTNKLLRREGFIGLKTGITATAGPCLAAAYNFRGKTYISVVLRAPKVSSRFKQTRKLLFWTMGQLHKDLTEQEYMQLRALKRENYELDSDYSQEEEEFKYGNNSLAEHQRRCHILEQL